MSCALRCSFCSRSGSVQIKTGCENTRRGSNAKGRGSQTRWTAPAHRGYACSIGGARGWMKSFTHYTDSAEGAFSMDVPLGWQVQGGMYRFGHFDVRWMMDVRSLDGKIILRISAGRRPTITPTATASQSIPTFHRDPDFTKSRLCLCSTDLRASGLFVNPQSYPIQDEPEGEVGFQHKMSLEPVAC
jgi:hypothetical protein